MIQRREVESKMTERLREAGNEDIEPTPRKIRIVGEELHLGRVEGGSGEVPDLDVQGFSYTKTKEISGVRPIGVLYSRFSREPDVKMPTVYKAASPES